MALLIADEDSFYSAIGPVLFTAQLFGVFPLSGILGNSPADLRVRCAHWSTVPFLYVATDTAVELLLCTIKELAAGVKLSTSAEIIFLGGNLFGILYFRRIAHRWPAIATEWQRTEAIFMRAAYPQFHRITLRLRVRVVAFTMLVAALIEHGLYIGSALVKNRHHIDDCHLHNVDFWERLFRTERAHIFHYLPYSHWLAAPCEYANVAITFCWSFIDVFVAVLAVALSARFAQLNERLQGARGRVMPAHFWYAMRCDYNRLAELVEFVDAHISGVLVWSCLSNLYFVCFLIFNSINKPPLLISQVYQWYSLVFIIARMLCTLYLAARVHDGALQPSMVLANVPTSCWTAEVQRFADQLVSDKVALSGRRFFYITRRTILAIVGTVLTYEIMLLSMVERVPHKEYSCNGTRPTPATTSSSQTPAT